MSPLLVLSHGTGGGAMGLAWLGRRMSAAGFVSVAVNHHGNSYVEPYHPEGFICLWERARDLTVLLDHLLSSRDCGSRIDQHRIFVAGFSAGAYTALQTLGARVQYSQFEPSSPIAGAGRGPREFPDLVDHLPDLLRHCETFRASWSRRFDDYRDDRIKAALLCAPGRSVRGFDETSLRRIEAPVHILVGAADAVAPPEECSVWLHERLRSSDLDILSANAGHYVFLPEAKDMAPDVGPEVARDAPGVDRQAIHNQTAAAALKLFRAC